MNNSFEKCLEKYYSNDELEIISKAEILVIGCGGLGSNLINSLVRSGVQNFTIIDFDKVELSNLNRQYYNFDDIGLYKVDAIEKNMLKINSNIKFNKIKKRVDSVYLQELRKYKIICECVDNSDFKKEIFEAFYNTDCSVYQANGMAFNKNDRTFDVKLINMKNITIVGDFTNDIKDFPPLSPRVNVVASLQAEMVLKDILTKNDKTNGL